MAEASLAITTEYVKCFLALMGKGIFWPDSITQRLAQSGISPLDVTFVMTHGDVVRCNKDDANGTQMTLVGYTCDEVHIKVTFWSDIDGHTLRILDVELI